MQLDTALRTGMVALASLGLAWLLAHVTYARYASRWDGEVRATMKSAGYRDAVRIEPGAGQVEPRVRVVVFLAFAQAVFLVLSNVDFAARAVQTDLWRVRPLLVRLAVIQDVFLLPAAVLFVYAAFRLVRRDSDGAARARFTAGALLAIRCMRVVAGVAVASEISSGIVAWSRIPPALPGLCVAVFETAMLLRAANRIDDQMEAQGTHASLAQR